MKKTNKKIILVTTLLFVALTVSITAVESFTVKKTETANISPTVTIRNALLMPSFTITTVATNGSATTAGVDAKAIFEMGTFKADGTRLWGRLKIETTGNLTDNSAFALGYRLSISTTTLSLVNPDDVANPIPMYISLFTDSTYSSTDSLSMTKSALTILPGGTGYSADSANKMSKATAYLYMFTPLISAGTYTNGTFSTATPLTVTASYD